jgi:hypothetical protein
LKARRDDDVRSTMSLTDMISKAVENKKESLPPEKKITISLEGALSASAHVNADPSQVEAAFTNILDNAVDAISREGAIVVRLYETPESALIEISDDGCGISEDVLPLLMQEGATFGKKDGNGLGLYHTKRTVDEAGGTIGITSKLAVGTTVRVEVPFISSARKKSNIIAIQRGQSLIVVDDDPCIHATVDTLIGQPKPFPVIHLHSIGEFESWMEANGAGGLNERVYWMDNDMKHDTLTGIALIEKYGLQFESYLVTGMDDPALKARARAGHIRFVPKDDIPSIRFFMNADTRQQEISLDVGIA